MDADAVRDELRGYVVDSFSETDAVLVVDETGDLKKGEKSVGVQRQYTGTAGRIENAQVAVFLTHAARRGHALVDRAPYLPKSGTSNVDRYRAAGVPDEVESGTKPALATAMVTRAVQAGVPAFCALLPPGGSPVTRHTAPIRCYAKRSATTTSATS